jgi:hypothetical protein
MWRFFSAVFVIVLVVMPRAGGAEGLAGYGMAPLHGFAELFRSLPSGVAPSIDPAARNAMAAAATTGRMNEVGTVAAGAICRPALIAAETRHGVPTGLLQAIGVVESGRRDEVTGRREPWPWTINAEGEPHLFETKQQAVAWVRQAQARGVQSIDVGCAQVNLLHHPTAFVSLEQAFDPASNADYAARFLRELHDTTAGGNWLTAAGHYHSQTPELAESYRQQVLAAMEHRSPLAQPVPAYASATYPVSPFAPAEPLPLTGGARPEPGRLLPAPSGTVGRGLDAYRAAPIQMAAAVRVLPVTAR